MINFQVPLGFSLPCASLLKVVSAGGSDLALLVISLEKWGWIGTIRSNHSEHCISVF